LHAALLDYLAGDCRRLAGGEEPAGRGCGQKHADDRKGEIEDRHVTQVAVAVWSDRRCGGDDRESGPNISADLPAETRDFFMDLLGFELATDMAWIVTVASPSDPGTP